METTAAASLTDQFRRLIEAVKGAFGLERRRGLLAGPMAPLFWLRARRMRREAEAAAKQFVVMMEQFLVLLKDFRAGKLTAPAAPELDEAWEAAEAEPGDNEERFGEYTSPSRFAGPSPRIKPGGKPAAERRGVSSAGPRSMAWGAPHPGPFLGEERENRQPLRFLAPSAVVPTAAMSDPYACGLDRRVDPRLRMLAQRARPPPDGAFFADNSIDRPERRRDACVHLVSAKTRLHI
jgi:hypothetical protein